MKKLLSTMLAAVTALTALATNYTGTLTVTINGTSANTESTINVEPNGDDYTLSINNFVLDGLPIGNIVLTASATKVDEATILKANKNITITPGDGDGWVGPQLGEVPVNMTSIFKDGAMFTNIDIYFALLHQTINVRFESNKGFVNHFGSEDGYQFPNSGFDDWHFYKQTGNIFTGKIDHYEPTGWHGFGSAKGSLAGMAKGQVIQSSDTRTGNGSCAMIQSGSTMGIVNNGTMTTGQLQAANTSAAHTDNHSEMIVAEDNNDEKGYPYYVILNGRPDSFSTWHKFTQGTVNSYHPYATVSAIITDGTYYQDPEDKEYTNKVAEARFTQIQRTSTWAQLEVPFTYHDNNLTPKGILVTFSTNADAGQGSDGDKLYVDDVALVYLGEVTNITVEGLDDFIFDAGTRSYSLVSEGTFTEDNVNVTKTGAYSYLLKSVNAVHGGYIITVTVIPNDMSKAEVYTINITTPTPLAEIIESGENGAEYTIAEDLAVVDIAQLENHAFVTDGNNNWLRVDFSDDIEDFVLMDVIKGGTLKGTLSNVELNPVFTVTEMPQEGENTVDFTVEKIDLAEEFTLKANQVVDAAGYWRAAQGCLRGYLSGGQSLTINSSWATTDNTMVDGQYYAVRCAISLKEAWKASAGIAPRDYDYDFQNYLGNMLVMPSTPTAIDAINTGSARQVEAIYNAQGQRVGKDAKGVLIVRYTDGTVAKVVR